MQNVYAALLLHKLGKPIDEAGMKSILQAAGASVDESAIKTMIASLKGVDIDKAEKTQIRKGKFTVHIDGKEYSCKVKDLNGAVEKACHYCDDFSAQLADISVGSVGSQIGYSTVIVRSEVAKKLLENLDVTKEAVDKEEIIKLSRLKKQRAKKNSSVYNRQQACQKVA